MAKKNGKVIVVILPILFFTIFILRLFGETGSMKLDSSIGGVYNFDGSKIAFFSNYGGGDQIWIMDADGKQLRNVTSGHKGDRWPQFSPDGETLTFMSNDDGEWEIYTIDIDGTNRTQISVNADTELGATFSGDGKTIFIGSINSTTGAKGLYSVDTSGNNRLSVIDNGLWPYSNVEGNIIVYGHIPQTQNEFDIWVYDTKTKSAHALTEHVGNNYGAKTNAQGTKVIFVSDREGAFSIFEMDADGSNQLSLNVPAIMDTSPYYAPDGKSILYTNISDKSGKPNLYKFDLKTKSINPIIPQE